MYNNYVMDQRLVVPPIDVRKRIPSEVITYLANQIAEQFNPKRIILFGSYAYGIPKPESDIDLLVVLDTPIRTTQVAQSIRQYLNPSFGLDLIIYTPSDLDKRLALGDSFLKEILSKGKILYESIDA